MSISVQINVAGSEDWELIWSGDWEAVPFIGMTFEIRALYFEQPTREEITGYYRVVGVHDVMFANEAFDSTVIVYCEEVELEETAPGRSAKLARRKG